MRSSETSSPSRWLRLLRVTGPVVAAAFGCANLPTIASGSCGNAVVEPPEDCDSFAPDAALVCLRPGTPGECHFDCRPRQDGTTPSCPAGWGCSAQGLCRPPTGQFLALPEVAVGGVRSLMAGDFDGDGRADIVSLEAPDVRAGMKARFHYFDENGHLEDTRPFPKLMGTPVVADVSRDDRSDILFSDVQFRVGVLPGRADRSAVPDTTGSFLFPNARIRVVVVRDEDVERSTAVMGLTSIGGVPGLYGPDKDGILRRRGRLSGPVETLVGDPVVAPVIENDAQSSPCAELLFALRGAASFVAADVCTTNAETGQVVWRDDAVQLSVALDPPAAIDAPPQAIDMNGDGHLDVLVGGSGRAYVAYGDGHGLATAVPYRLPGAGSTEPPPDVPMPLAVGDFTGDGLVDFVFGDHLLVSVPDPAGATPAYRPTHFNQSAPWTVARIADLNGNGKPDVVAASSARLGIDFFNGSGTANLFAFELPTSGPVGMLGAKDFDGDLVDDLAFVESTTSDGERDALKIAFGALAGPPTAATTVARIAHIEQIFTFTEQGLCSLAITYSETVAGSDRGVLALLSGGGDRLPAAPYELVDAAGGSVFRAAAAGIAVGRFTTADSPGDVLALATPDTVDYAFWLLPSPGTSPTTAVRLGGQLDPRLRPSRFDGPNIVVNLAAAAVDLDGDGVDESVWAMPADDGVRCGLVIAGAAGGRMIIRSTAVLDEPCLAPQLLAVDPDGDHGTDVALLTGSAGVPGRKLLVLWNDGAGGLSTAVASLVSAPGDSPEQFTVLPATALAPFAFAYVTDQTAVTTTATPGARSFEPPRALASLRQGTGIVAADVNGDGIRDVALAASGNLRVLQAALLQ